MAVGMLDVSGGPHTHTQRYRQTDRQTYIQRETEMERVNFIYWIGIGRTHFCGTAQLKIQFILCIIGTTITATSVALTLTHRQNSNSSSSGNRTLHWHCKNDFQIQTNRNSIPINPINYTQPGIVIITVLLCSSFYDFARLLLSSLLLFLVLVL